MANLKTLLIIALLTILSVSSFAGLTLKSSIAEISSKIYNQNSGATFWTGSGPMAGYVDVSGYSYYIYAQKSITNTDDYIHNSFTSNRDHYYLNRYRFNYNSAITFSVVNPEETAAIIVTQGDLYLNGAQLQRELDGSYIVPTSQDLIATFAYVYNTTSSTNISTIYDTCPKITTVQDIYLQGYTMPQLPEPATIGLLGSGLLFIRRIKKGGVKC